MICTAAASLSRRRLRSADPVSSVVWVRSQSRSAGSPKPERCAVFWSSWVTCARSVISRSPPCQDNTCLPIPASCAASSTAATPRSRACPAQLRSSSAIRSVSESPPAARLSAVSRKKTVDAAARTRPGRCGCSNASSRHSQSCAAAEANTLESPVYTAGIPASASALSQARASLWVSTMTAISRASSGRPGERGATGQQRADIGGQVAADVLAQAVDADGAGALAAAGHHPQPERIVAGRAGEPVALMMRGDVVHDDAGPTELRAAQHHLQPVHQGGVTAPVDAEGLLVPGGLRGPQVGVDIAATEGVDGLLGVADQDQRRLPRGRPAR